MNDMLMMAMMMAATNPGNGLKTAQTVLGASDQIPQAGRMAFSMMRQQADDAERTQELRALGLEVVGLMRESKNYLTKQHLEKLPRLRRALALADYKAPDASKLPVVNDGHNLAPPAPFPPLPEVGEDCDPSDHV